MCVVQVCIPARIPFQSGPRYAYMTAFCAMSRLRGRKSYRIATPDLHNADNHTGDGKSRNAPLQMVISRASACATLSDTDHWNVKLQGVCGCRIWLVGTEAAPLTGHCWSHEWAFRDLRLCLSVTKCDLLNNISVIAK